MRLFVCTGAAFPGLDLPGNGPNDKCALDALDLARIRESFFVLYQLSSPCVSWNMLPVEAGLE